LIAERGEQGIIDLRSGEEQSYLVREKRHLLIDRPKRLDASALPSRSSRRWFVGERTEEILKALGER
jgi:hypothetical protein